MPKKVQPVSSVADRELALMKAAGYKVRYAPRGASKQIFTMKDEEILLAGPAGTGKSLSHLQKVHLVLSKYPGSKGAMCRKTRTSMTNSCLDMFNRHVLKVIDKVHLHKQDQQFNYPNGSLLAIIGLDDPERIKSTEWDIIYIQEATECTENDWEMCISRLRNGVVPYQQLLGDCNPDKPTHWLKKRGDKGLTTILPSFHEDNPRLYNELTGTWTTEGLVYRAKLDRLTGVRRARLYLGQWVAAEGMVYDTWDPSIHMISLADLPSGWESWAHYWAVDWGFSHPACLQDWIEDPSSGALYRLREVYHTKWLVEDLAKYIMSKTEGIYVPRAIICDHDLEDRKTFERYTGYLTLPAYKHIQPGIQAVTSRLDKNWHGTGKPGLFLVRDASIIIDRDLKDEGLPTSTEEEVDGYVWDKDYNRTINSKKDELPIDKDNHGMDAERYMVAFADDLAEDPAEFEEALMLGDENMVTISPY